MARPLSNVAPDWWDYTTLEPELLADAARLSAEDILQLARPGFEVFFYDTLEELYLAEALEYIDAWRQSTPDNPVGICGPIGPTEQLPLVARLVNDLELDIRDGHFWGMDEWYLDGEVVSGDHPLSFERADRELLFDRIRPNLVPPDSHLHFPTADVDAFEATWSDVRCAVMQGGQGEVKHWAFNDPPRREGKWQDAPPSPEEVRTWGTRLVELHPLTLVQNARTSAGGNLPIVPRMALTVGPKQTWQAERVSIWHPGHHDNPFGLRLTALMIGKGIADAAVPMSLLADHPNVRFSYYRGGLGSTIAEMH